jgi:hypothetical protein
VDALAGQVESLAAADEDVLGSIVTSRIILAEDDWRRGSESNRRIKVLQTSPLPLGYRALLVSVLFTSINNKGERPSRAILTSTEPNDNGEKQIFIEPGLVPSFEQNHVFRP